MPMNWTFSAPHLSFQNLSALNVPHCITTREWGSLNPFVGYQGLSRLAQGIGVAPGELLHHVVYAEQIHSAGVHCCHASDAGSIRLGVDGLAGTDPGLLLTVYVADCLPVLIYDPVRNAAAALHAGRRGVLDGILDKGIIELGRSYGSKPENLRVGLGPGLRSCCYEIREDIFPELEAGHCMQCVGRRDHGYYLDLPQACIARLQERGVSRDNIEDMDLCTACHREVLFSARRRTDVEEPGSAFAAMISPR